MSVKRLRTFLKNEELDPTIVQWRPAQARGEHTHTHIATRESEGPSVTHCSVKLVLCINWNVLKCDTLSISSQETRMQ